MFGRASRRWLPNAGCIGALACGGYAVKTQAPGGFECQVRSAGSRNEPRLVKVATCNLNQWAMDFKGNLERIKDSIREAKQQGCRFRTGPELEITGYGCEDHFLENDTFVHAWASLEELLKDGLTDGILCDIGMPILHRNVSYNCRVWVLNGKIVGIRPKIFMANDGNYREMRWFTPWFIDPSNPGFGQMDEYFLPRSIAEITGQTKVPIGIFAVAAKDTCLATETCEELFTPDAPHIKLSLDGVEILANGSGSHHQLRKLDKRIDLLRGATSKAGGVYLYANQKGCDGGRLYYDGCCTVWQNGQMLAQGSQFGQLDEVEVVTATVDLTDVRAFRANFIARSFQASSAPKIPRVDVDFSLCCPDSLTVMPSAAKTPFIHPPMEEIAFGPSAWLWDYLRRSGQRGYFLPLSGGADSSSTAALVGIMCQRVFDELQNGSERSKKQVLEDIRKITKRPTYYPESWQDLCGKIFVTSYMASQYSGDETTQRAIALASSLGANHTEIAIAPITSAIKECFKDTKFYSFDKTKVKSDVQWDSTGTEDIALQNIQARTRMVMAYFMAQLMPWATDSGEAPGWGSLLVLGSANVDEALRGYYTKYDCSAADINPIGGINKRDLKDFLEWAGKNRQMPILQAVADAVPTAELRPEISKDGKEVEAQSDEKDMGMSYAELGDLGHCRKVLHCGPLSTYIKLRTQWAHKTKDWKSPADNEEAITPSIRATGANAPKTYEEKVAQKVKDFFFYNAINRHKMTTLTPSYHAENYSPDDNRFDLRPFLFRATFDAQFAAIDELVKKANASGGFKPSKL